MLDLATPAFAYTDRNHSLQSGCHAFGVPFEERPGLHSGEITRGNVEGCLYDVRKTSELLWAIDAEHRRHPIDLHLSRAQSGASIAKAYLDALGVRPRSEIQPAFPKEYLGYAAQAYFGGRVEARIVKTLLPCVYLDFLSMYPTVFALLGLWFKHVIPETLEVDEIEPAEVSALLERLREYPDDLFDRATWKRLDFFALVEPNGAHLPARAIIPRVGLSRCDKSRAATHEEPRRKHLLDPWTSAAGIVPDSLRRKRKRWKPPAIRRHTARAAARSQRPAPVKPRQYRRDNQSIATRSAPPTHDERRARLLREHDARRSPTRAATSR